MQSIQLTAALLAALAAGHAPTQEQIHAVRQGRLAAGRFDPNASPPWRSEDGAALGAPKHNPLVLPGVMGSAFEMKVTLRALPEDRFVTTLVLGDDRITIDLQKNEIRTVGTQLGPPKRRASIERDGDPVTLEVRAADERLHVTCGSVRFSFPAPPSCRYLAVEPVRGDTAVLQFSAQVLPMNDVRVPSRAYTIPTLDLATDASRQVVVDREKGQYLGHPTTVLLEDHRTMIAVYPKGHGKGAIVMKRSTDAGKTWSDRLPTPASWSTSKETPTIHRVVDKAGTKRLIMFSGLYPIRMSVSEDDGASWSELEPIGDYGGIVAMGCVERLKDSGDYIALFHDDGRFIRGGGKRANPVTFRVYQVRSTDGGLTWSEPRTIYEGSRLHLCEPGLIRSPDGDTMAVLFRENSRRYNGHVIFSDDEAETWSAPRELPAALTGDRHIGRYAQDGRLFVTFRDRTLSSPTSGDWVAWVGTWDDIVNGAEGQYRVRLMDNHKGADCAYPGLEILPDDTLVTTTYGHWTKSEQPWIASVRLKLSELDELTKR